MDAAGVLPGFRGVAVHDGWSPYWRYQDATHALCGTHLLRELEAVAEEPRPGWAAGMAELLCDAALVADRAVPAGPVGWTTLRGRGCGPATSGCWPTASAPTYPCPTRRGIVAGSSGHPPSTCWNGGRPPRRGAPVPGRPARAVHQQPAERDIRMVKLQQKVSGCWRTPAGAEAFLIVRSYTSTARKQGMNPLAVLRQLFKGTPWLPVPANI
jgi:transposase